MSTALVWFRNDLRVYDHEALFEASKFDFVIPFYCFEPRQFGHTSFGFPKTGRHRTRFLIESVTNLRENLQKLDTDLVVRTGKPEKILSDLVEKYKVDKLFAYGEPATGERAVEDAVKSALSIKTQFFWEHSLYHLDDILYEPDKIPQTFTSFRKQVEKKSEVRQCFPNPGKIRLPDDGKIAIEQDGEPINPSAINAPRG